MYSMGSKKFCEPHMCVEVRMLNFYTIFPESWKKDLTVTTKFLAEWQRMTAGKKLCRDKLQKYRGFTSKVDSRPRQSYQIVFSAFALEDVTTIRESK